MDTASFAIGIAGIAIGIPSLFGITVSIRKRYPWKIIMKGIEEVSDQIEHKGSKPDTVIALGDGAVPAAALALNLGISALYFIDAPTAGRAETGRPSLNTNGLPSSLKGRRVLIVDNHVFTGANMAAAKEIVLSLEPEDVKTCALFYLDSVSSIVTLNYSYRSFDGQQIPVPWDYSRLHKEAYVASSHSHTR